MANRFQTPVCFTMEKNVVQIFARVVFGASNVPVLDTNQSKGFCNVGFNTPVFTGTTASGSSSISSVSSFQGLFTGMTLSGSGVSGTIGTMTAATSTIVMSAPATSAQATTTITATGGQYIFQLGQQAGTRLDSYAKLLDFNYSFSEDTGSASGSFQQLQLAPAAQNGFLIANNTKVRTIPATLTSNSTDCTIIVQFGNGSGTGFVAASPANGEVLRINLGMGNSTAP